MTRKEFKAFAFLPQEKERCIHRIERLEKSLADVPTVKSKVQSSQKDFPYIRTSVTVDAPEPVRYSALKRDLYRAKRRLIWIEKRTDKLYAMIESIEDSRTRQILSERYIEGRKLKDVALRFDLTEQHVMRIIRDSIEKF